jgi:hypothetical protein
VTGDGWDGPPPEQPKAPAKPRGRHVLFACLAACVVLAWLATVVFTPWGFFLGGRFHLYPRWQGWGRMHSTTAGDFVLFVSLVPGRTGRSRTGPPSGPRLAGNAVLCTPRGERFALGVGGEMERHFGLDFQGRTVELDMRSSSFVDRQLGRDLRPKIKLFGRWNNPDLVMDDHGTLSHAFEPDGSLYKGSMRNRPELRETVLVTLREGARSDFETACAAAKTSSAR